MYVTRMLVTRREILQCVLQSVMPYHVGYKHVCNLSGDPTVRVTSVMPYNECYTHACNPNGVPKMRITKRSALPCGLQANL
eukprot:6212185-Pleurochrysis_carterae.AAC.2